MPTSTPGQPVGSRGRCTPLHLHPLLLLLLLLLAHTTSRPAQAAIDIPPNYQIPDFKKPPEITAQPESITAFSSDIMLTCEASGNPKPTFRWVKDGVEFDLSSDPDLKVSTGSGTFSVAAEDQPISQYSGNYTCFASNELGTAVSNEVQITTENPPTMQKEKKVRLKVEAGESVVLRCNPPASIIPPNIHWMDDKLHHIKLNERVVQGLDGNLYFAHTKVEDSRNDYTCNMRYARTMFSKEPITLVVNPSNSVVRNRRPQMLRPTGSQSSHHVLRGQTLKLECIVQGLPTPTVQWVRKDGEMSESRILKMNNGTLLHFSDVQEGDGGQYQCTASNSQGTATHVYSVSVEAAPYWKKEPLSQLYAPGETVRLDCEADGIPRPHVAWSINGNPLSEIDPDPRRSLQAGVLSLKNVDYSDTAVFQCKATNKHGSIVTNTYVYVIELPPQILTPNDKRYTVIEGQKAELECKSFGSPRPVVIWENEDLDSPLSPPRVTQLSRGALQIANVSSSDGGLYTCSIPQAKISISAMLEVFNRTEIISPPLELRVQRGKPAIFTCIAKVDPRLDHQLLWRRGRQKLMGSSIDDKYTFEDPDLIVANVQEEDKGEYTCEIITDLDTAKAIGSITIVDFPDPPSRPQISNPKARSLTLSWTPGDNHNSPVIEFVVETEVTGVETDDWEVLLRVAGDTLRANIPLRPFLSYRFRVLAINDVGMSKPSPASKPHSTPATAPESNPVGVRSESVDPDTLVISWEEMDRQSFNGPEFQYKVMWRRVVGAGPRWSFNFTTEPPYVVNRVGNFTAFDIKVQAVNELGPAPDPVPTIGYSGEDVPLEAPMDVGVALINSTTIKVTWAAVNKETVRGHLLGYKIHLRNHGPQTRHHREQPARRERELPREVVVATGPNEQKRMVGDLQPYSRYTISVSVFNSKGEGPASEPFSFHTPEGVPSPPVSLELDSPSETEMTLHWKPPAQPNGVLQGYLLQYQRIVVTEDSPMQVVSIDDPEVTSETLKQLDPHSRYRFHVRGRTSTGEGQPATREGATTLDGAPPANINISVGETFVNLSWPSGERHRSVGFHVRYLSKNGWGKGWTASERLDSSQSFYQLQGLQPGSQYRLELIYNNTAYWNREIQTEGAGVMQVQSGFATEGWFIGLVSAIALLVLLLLILCFIKRSKGGKYSVKDKEEGHIDSEARPMKDETFGEYRSDNDEKRTASQPSLCDDSKLCSDDGNLDDYGNSHSVQTEVIMDESLASQYSGGGGGSGIRDGPETEAPGGSPPLAPPAYTPTNHGLPISSPLLD
ncbi:neural cell adhesion molecule L1.2 isoform X3 [Alosa alosa]|uniref:neural cell adhesion molecule L1.2 isoform X3 n=1 Tax=Alosa alosa TaxID=278164 RepID=UPI002015448B|nr:neural cell adhesion molecule L1.2 isoform X3 [Alosa alosa]